MWHPAVEVRFKISYSTRHRKLRLGRNLQTSLFDLAAAFLNEIDDDAQVEVFLPRWRDVDVDAEVLLAAMSVAVFTKCPCRTQALVSFLAEFQRDANPWENALKEARSRMKTLEAEEQCNIVPTQSNQYTWLRQKNDVDSRFLRLTAACSALRFALHLFRQQRHENKMARMIEQTQLLSLAHLQSRPLPEKTMKETKFEIAQGRTLLEHAVSAATEGGEHVRVVVVSAASGYHVGGGFLSGGRHALEEAICMQSTLYPSLAKASDLAKSHRLRGILGRPIHIPEDGCVMTPDVEILRYGTDYGYDRMETTVSLSGILSIAMPNKNTQVFDSPFDERCGQEYSDLLKNKFDAVLLGAISLEAEVLVIPDCGCGVFKNDPSNVGRSLGEALREKNGFFKKVLLAGSAEFANAVITTINACREC